MATYLILNSVVFIIAGIVFFANRQSQVNRRIVLLTVIILFILTAFFDSLLIAADIVRYDISKILQLYIGKAPVEDFAYVVVAAMIVPYLWYKLERKQK